MLWVSSTKNHATMATTMCSSSARTSPDTGRLKSVVEAHPEWNVDMGDICNSNYYGGTVDLQWYSVLDYCKDMGTLFGKPNIQTSGKEYDEVSIMQYPWTANSYWDAESLEQLPLVKGKKTGTKRHRQVPSPMQRTRSITSRQSGPQMVTWTVCEPCIRGELGRQYLSRAVRSKSAGYSGLVEKQSAIAHCIVDRMIEQSINYQLRASSDFVKGEHIHCDGWG